MEKIKFPFNPSKLIERTKPKKNLTRYEIPELSLRYVTLQSDTPFLIFQLENNRKKLVVVQ